MRFIYIFIPLLLGLACTRSAKLDRLFEKPSPYRQYLQKLEDSDLDHSRMGRAWIAAGQQSLTDSLLIALPYRETGYLSPEKPEALGLRFPVQEGQSILVHLEPLTQPDSRFFLDVFEIAQDSSLTPIHHADSLPQLQYRASRSGWHLLRVQPELLSGGAFTLEISFAPSLSFPVSGRDSRAVQSFFGADRDGGRRSHKGIDIFAPRGTPVLAVADGIIRRRTYSGRGGKVVWLSSPENRFSLYYAHLDSQAVAPGQRVQIGDTLGFVGNTGNARTTPPHLHFSIYKSGRGAVDPFPFVYAPSAQSSLLASDPSEVGIQARTLAPRSNVRRAASLQSEVTGSIPRHTWLEVAGKSGKWFRVRLADGQAGYVHQSLVEPLNAPLTTMNLPKRTPLYFSEAYGQDSTHVGWLGDSLQVLAYHQGSSYVKSDKGFYGWLSAY